MIMELYKFIIYQNELTVHRLQQGRVLGEFHLFSCNFSTNFSITNTGFFVSTGFFMM